MFSKLIKCFLLLQMGSFAEAAPRFQKVMIVIFENTNYKDTIVQPFFLKFSRMGALLTKFKADVHPSQGNYIALTSGDSFGIHSDKNIDLNVSNIADLLETKGLTWKVYAEGYPGNCFLGEKSGRYVRKHVPFLSYVNIQKNLKRCANIVEASQMDIDIKNNNLPNYSLYIPDMDNDGHDTGVAFADKWFAKKFEPLLNNSVFMKDMLVVATFDESKLLGGNKIYTAFYGSSISAGTSSAINYTHYSLLRTIEDNFELGTLGRKDANASPIEDVWR